MRIKLPITLRIGKKHNEPEATPQAGRAIPRLFQDMSLITMPDSQPNSLDSFNDSDHRSVDSLATATKAHPNALTSNSNLNSTTDLTKSASFINSASTRTIATSLSVEFKTKNLPAQPSVVAVIPLPANAKTEISENLIHVVNAHSRLASDAPNSVFTVDFPIDKESFLPLGFLGILEEDEQLLKKTPSRMIPILNTCSKILPALFTMKTKLRSKTCR